MLKAADAGRRVVEFARLLLRERDQLLHVVHRQLRIDGKHVRTGRENRNWREGSDRIVVELVERRVHRMRDRDDQQRVAVRRCGGRGLGAEHTAGAAAIVDEHLVPELFGKLVRYQSPDHIVAAAGRKRNDQPYRLVGIFSRCWRGKRQQQRKCTPKFHLMPRSSTSIDTPSGPRMKQILMPGRGEFSSMVNSAPFALRSATTLSMSFTRSPK